MAIESSQPNTQIVYVTNMSLSCNMFRPRRILAGRFLTLREERRMSVFENRVLKRIFGPTRAR